jgi:hypothetical protein
MPTLNQVAARAANAKLSKGPVTEEGKVASSGNALKHGLCARKPLLPDEDEAEWVAFRDNLIESLAPAGHTEIVLADCIVHAAWRLRRFPAVEAGLLTRELNNIPEPKNSDDPNAALSLAFIRGCGFSHLPKLSRYETAIERTMIRFMQRLEHLQSARNGRLTAKRRVSTRVKLRNDLTEGLTATETAA